MQIYRLQQSRLPLILALKDGPLLVRFTRLHDSSECEGRTRLLLESTALLQFRPMLKRYTTALRARLPNTPATGHRRQTPFVPHGQFHGAYAGIRTGPGKLRQQSLMPGGSNRQTLPVPSVRAARRLGVLVPRYRPGTSCTRFPVPFARMCVALSLVVLGVRRVFSPRTLASPADKRRMKRRLSIACHTSHIHVHCRHVRTQKDNQVGGDHGDRQQDGSSHQLAPRRFDGIEPQHHTGRPKLAQLASNE